MKNIQRQDGQAPIVELGKREREGERSPSISLDSN